MAPNINKWDWFSSKCHFFSLVFIHSTLVDTNIRINPRLVNFPLGNGCTYIIMSVYLITLYLVISNKLIKFNKVVIVLGLILLLQIVLGILTVTSGAQMFIASMHQISSILLVSFSVYFLFINTKKINLQP